MTGRSNRIFSEDLPVFKYAFQFFYGTFNGIVVLWSDSQFRQIEDRQFHLVVHVFVGHLIDNHTYCTGVVGNRVNQDEGTGSFVLCIWVEE